MKNQKVCLKCMKTKKAAIFRKFDLYLNSILAVNVPQIL